MLEEQAARREADVASAAEAARLAAEAAAAEERKQLEAEWEAKFKQERLAAEATIAEERKMLEEKAARLEAEKSTYDPKGKGKGKFGGGKSGFPARQWSSYTPGFMRSQWSQWRPGYWQGNSFGGKGKGKAENASMVHEASKLPFPPLRSIS